MGQGRDRAFTGFFVLVVSATMCGVLALAVPRPVDPSQLPPLQLDPRAVRESLAQDRELARQAPMGAEADALRALYRADGEAELRGSAGVQDVPGLRRQLTSGVQRLLSEAGHRALLALRAEATEQAMAELLASGPGETYSPLLGRFPELLHRYGALYLDRRLRAPLLTLRSAYKVRWNMVHGRPSTADLLPVELQAYYGFIALHASGIPPEQRATAAGAFYAAGGKRSGEAYAVWLFQGGERERARKLMQRAYERSGELRLRNMALAMLFEE